MQVTAGVTTLAALGLGEKGFVSEPNHPRLVRIELSLARWPSALDGFTIAQLSDFHYDPYLSIIAIRKAVDIVNQLNADLVVLTGDFVTVPVLADYLHNRSWAVRAAEPCALLLAGLRSRLGSVAVLGNHDADAGAEPITATLESHGIPVLCNRSLPIERAGARFWLTGLDDVMDGNPDPDLALQKVPKEEPVVLMVHEPDFVKRVVRYPVDLQLSGHSHGGQVWLPGLGAPWLPPLARRYPRGLYRVGNTTLYTNIGLGTIRIPVRWNCPPEVTLFILRAANANQPALP